MKVFITWGFVILFFISLLLFFMGWNFEGVTSIELVNDSKIYAGEYEPCKTPENEIECTEGLECVLTSTIPYENGICLKEGTELGEDFTNRNNLSIN